MLIPCAESVIQDAPRHRFKPANKEFIFEGYDSILDYGSAVRYGVHEIIGTTYNFYHQKDKIVWRPSRLVQNPAGYFEIINDTTALADSTSSCRSLTIHTIYGASCGRISMYGGLSDLGNKILRFVSPTPRITNIFCVHELALAQLTHPGFSVGRDVELALSVRPASNWLLLATPYRDADQRGVARRYLRQAAAIGELIPYLTILDQYGELENWHSPLLPLVRATTSAYINIQQAVSSLCLAAYRDHKLDQMSVAFCLYAYSRKVGLDSESAFKLAGEFFDNASTSNRSFFENKYKCLLCLCNLKRHTPSEIKESLLYLRYFYSDEKVRIKDVEKMSAIAQLLYFPRFQEALAKDAVAIFSTTSIFTVPKHEEMLHELIIKYVAI